MKTSDWDLAAWGEEDGARTLELRGGIGKNIQIGMLVSGSATFSGYYD